MPAYYAPGEYIGEVVDQGINQAKTGTYQFFVRFAVVAKVDPSLPEGANAIGVDNNYERTLFRAISEKTSERLAHDLRQLGFNGDQWSDLDPRAADAWNLIGSDVRVICRHEVYNGENRERWDFALGGNAQEIQKIEGKQARELDTLFGKALKAAPKVKSAEAPKPAPAAAATTTAEPTTTTTAAPADDDLPF